MPPQEQDTAKGGCPSWSGHQPYICTSLLARALLCENSRQTPLPTRVSHKKGNRVEKSHWHRFWKKSGRSLRRQNLCEVSDFWPKGELCEHSIKSVRMSDHLKKCIEVSKDHENTGNWDWPLKKHFRTERVSLKSKLFRSIWSYPTKQQKSKIILAFRYNEKQGKWGCSEDVGITAVLAWPET